MRGKRPLSYGETGVNMNAMEIYRQWVEKLKDSTDPSLRSLYDELVAVKDDETEITERFGKVFQSAVMVR